MGSKRSILNSDKNKVQQRPYTPYYVSQRFETLLGMAFTVFSRWPLLRTVQVKKISGNISSINGTVLLRVGWGKEALLF